MTRTIQTELLSFIGLRNVFCDVLSRFARITTPLTGRLERPASDLGNLSDEKLTAQRTSRKKLISPSILALRRNKARYTFSRAVSDWQIELVFPQKNTTMSADQLIIGRKLWTTTIRTSTQHVENASPLLVLYSYYANNLKEPGLRLEQTIMPWKGFSTWWMSPENWWDGDFDLCTTASK